MDINEREEVMTDKKQQKEQEELRAARLVMIRVLSILAAVAALAVTAAPVGSAHNQPFDDGAGNAAAGLTKAAPPKAGASKARVGGKMHLEDISLGVKPTPTKARVGGKMHVDDISLGVKQYDQASPY